MYVMLDVIVTSRPSYMGDKVADDDETSRTPLISLPFSTMHYPALPCPTLLNLVMSVF